MTTRPCPSCSSLNIVKNGRIHNGKQNHKCRDCGRQFVEDPQKKRITPTTKGEVIPSVQRFKQWANHRRRKINSFRDCLSQTQVTYLLAVRRLIQPSVARAESTYHICHNRLD